MHPPFSLFATKKTGRARSKRKSLAAGIFPSGENSAENGGLRNRCGGIREFVPDASVVLGNRGWCRPAYGGVGTAFGVVIGFCTLPAPCVPLRYELPGGGRTANSKLAERQRLEEAGQIGLAPYAARKQSVAGGRAESFSKIGAPVKTQQSGFRGERTSVGMSELSA